jgi:hypothetical protein
MAKNDQRQNHTNNWGVGTMAKAPSHKSNNRRQRPDARETHLQSWAAAGRNGAILGALFKVPSGPLPDKKQGACQVLRLALREPGCMTWVTRMGDDDGTAEDLA